MLYVKKLGFIWLSGLVLALSCSKEKTIENRSNCILISSIQEGRKIDEYLIDNGVDGTVDLYLRCERENYANSTAYLAQYTFNRIREVQGNSRLVYEIKHPENGQAIQVSAETRVIDSSMQIELDKKYRDNN